MAFAVFQVRGWAIASVRDLGLLNPDDYDFLAEVIGWMINVVQFNLFENIDSLIQENDADRELPFDCLPPHLFMELDERFYWQSLFVLIRQMDVSTVQTCFMTSQPGHDELLTTILLSMEEQGNNFFLIIIIYYNPSIMLWFNSIFIILGMIMYIKMICWKDKNLNHSCTSLKSMNMYFCN